EEWGFLKTAVDGSSYYKFAKRVGWVNGNIWFHQVNHLSPRGPNYKLEEAHETTPPLKQATTITLTSSLKSIRFRLYDEANRSFVSFREVKHLLRKPKQSIQITPRKSSVQEK